MVRALRVITVERGIDPRGFDLLPFGGAGPLHAIPIAAELGIDRVLCPRSGGVLSALGLVCAERRRDTTRTVSLTGSELTRESLAAAVAATREGLEAPAGATLEAIYELRYRGQSFELPLDGPLDPDPAELTETFAAEHERRYGYREDDDEVELVNLRLAAREELSSFTPPRAGADEPRRSRREARFGRRVESIEVVTGYPGAGLRIAGPCVFELPETTFLVPAGWGAEVDGIGTIVATREAAR
jgi:N-methylhydantoinase A